MDATSRLTPGAAADGTRLRVQLRCDRALAFADDYHTTCVGHGFVHGAQPDGRLVLRSRGDRAAARATRSCDLYVSGNYIGGLSVGNATCNAWSRDYGNYTECHATAHLDVRALVQRARPQGVELVWVT